MSRYDEICRSSETALRNYYDHKDRVDNFLRRRFLPRFLGFLECPEDKLWTFDYDESWEQCPLSKAMRANDECYWTVGLGIRMERPNGFFDIGYCLRCRGIDDRFTVQIAERTFVIENDTDLEACFEHIFWHIKHKNEEGLNDTLRGGSSRKIGFSTEVTR